MEDETGGAVL